MARSGAHGEPQLTLAEHFLVAIGRGQLAVEKATEWAMARVAEGGADGTMTSLARCAGSNPERTLHEWCKQAPWRKAVPQPYSFMAPVVAEGKETQGELHCLLPHELFAALSAEVPNVFEELFGSREDREAFWAEMARTARESGPGHRGAEHRRWCEQHPCAWSRPCHRVPLGMHGDGGEMHGGEKVMVVSWGGLCLHSSTLDTRLLFCCLKDSSMVKEGHATLYKALSVLQWSFGCLATGGHPACDHEGQPFSADHHPARRALAGKPLVKVKDGNLLGAWCELRGDWQFLREALNLAHHYGKKEVCHLCAAETPEGEHCMANFALDGPLRRTLVGPQPGQWHTDVPISPLCKLPGFSIWRCMFDMMHTLELGLLQRAVPAALQGLMGLKVGKGPPQEPSAFEGRGRAARCKAATMAYLCWAKRHGVPASSRVKVITPRWVQDQWPTISQQHAKAAALRACLPWVVELADKRADQSKAAGLRAACLRGFAHMDRVYRAAPRFLTAGEETEAMQHCSNALTALAALAKLTPDGPWRLQPKAHALMHLACDSAMGNPRVAHCYQDEDFVGRTKSVYIACHGKSAPLRALERYSLACSVALTAREELIQGKRSPKAAALRGGPLRPTGAGLPAAGKSKQAAAGSPAGTSSSAGEVVAGLPAAPSSSMSARASGLTAGDSGHAMTAGLPAGHARPLCIEAPVGLTLSGEAVTTSFAAEAASTQASAVPKRARGRPAKPQPAPKRPRPGRPALPLLRAPPGNPDLQRAPKA